MNQNWQPDIKDYNIINREKAEFILSSAEKYLSATIKVSEEQDKKAFQLLSILIALISAVIGYALLKCDFITRQCTTETNIFWPAVSLIMGFLIAALITVIGCLFPKNFHFEGNEPKNLIIESICQLDIHDIKTTTAIAMQQRIAENQSIIGSKGLWLSRAFAVTILTPLLVVTFILIESLIYFYCPALVY